MIPRSFVWKVLALASGLCLFVAFVVAGAGFLPPVGAEAKVLVPPYAIDLATDGVTVLWQTESPSAGAVRYRAAGGVAWAEAPSAGAGAFHSVRLAKLQAGTEYEAEALAGGKKVGALAFRTAPTKADEFTFYAYGDTRSHPRDHKRVVAGLLAEVNRSGQHTFLLHTGDFAEEGSDEQSTAEQFFRPAAPLLARLPVVPVRGNHENKTDLFRRYFPAPGEAQDQSQGETFCLDYGSVRLIVLDKYLSPSALEAQKKWLGEKLAEANDRWRLVSLHEPLYTSGKYGPATTTRGRIEPVLVAGKVHAVLAGHDHNYERTHPIHGITHLVAGGGGAPLREKSSVADKYNWSAKFEETLHFLTVDVRPDKLTVKAWRPPAKGDAFEVFDTVEIPRDCGWPAAVSQPTSEPATSPAP